MSTRTPSPRILVHDSVAAAATTATHMRRAPRVTRMLAWTLAAGVLAAMCGLCSPAVAAPQPGWWWNPAQSGRGFFIESQGGILYMAAYLYADDGRARWLVAGGSNADPDHYSGRLLEYSGGQTMLGAYVAPAAPVDVGPVAVDFSDDTHGSITWAGGVVPIEREIFGSGQAAFLPESGWWWNPAESGSGYSIEVQGDNLFFVGFMYDDAGHPVWYYSAGPMTSATTYAGALLQFAGGQTLTGAYHPPGAPASVGNVAIEFTAPDAATLTLGATGALAHDLQAKAGTSRSIAITREFKPGPHRYDFPLGFAGSFSQTLELHLAQAPLDVTVTAQATGTGLIWDDTQQHPPPPPGTDVKGQLTRYVPRAGGQVALTVSYRATATGISCTGSKSGRFDFKDLQGALLISNLAEYIMQIGMAGDDLKLTVPVTCTIGTRTMASDPYDSALPIKLVSKVLFANQDERVIGSIGPVQETAVVKRSGSWQLTPLLNGF